MMHDADAKNFNRVRLEVISTTIIVTVKRMPEPELFFSVFFFNLMIMQQRLPATSWDFLLPGLKLSGAK